METILHQQLTKNINNNENPKTAKNKILKAGKNQ